MYGDCTYIQHYATVGLQAKSLVIAVVAATRATVHGKEREPTDNVIGGHAWMPR